MTKHFSPLVGKPSTGEPDAGEPHVRFGGRGGATQCVVPTPIEYFVSQKEIIFENHYRVVLNQFSSRPNSSLYETWE